MNDRGVRAVLRDAWRLTRPYFWSEERWAARGLLLVIILMNLSQVGVTVLLNSWRGEFYDALQNKDFPGFLNLILLYRWNENGFMPGFVPIVTIFIPIAIYAIYLTQLLQLRWRTWMTRHTLSDWLTGRAYYTIGLQNAPQAAHAAPDAVKNTDNPDQRIAEDLNSFTNTTLTIGLDFLSTVVSLVSFAQILWTLSGSIVLLGVTVPGYMLFIAIVYAVVGTVLTHLIGRPLAALEFDRQKVEADFRFGLVRLRENAEGVALYGGERAEERGLLARFAAVVAVTRGVMSRKKKLNALINGYAQIAAIFPIVVASPRYFAGEIALGGLMRISGAFSQVQSSLSWFVDSYAQLAVWRATVDRLTSFRAAIATAQTLAEGGVRVRQGGGDAITLDDVTLALPDGRILLNQTGPLLARGTSTVVSGRSGSGKSTLFRAIAGIWPFGRGTVERPPGTVLFLPQRPYIPLGTLRQAVTYPAEPGTIPDAAVHQALADAGLAALAPELDADEPWAQRLSGGEQQRLAVARALLLRPDWLFLDEATASLDPEAEADMYRALRDRLPGTTILSIAHRPAVADWHERQLRMADGALA